MPELTNVTEFIADLDGGVLEEKLSRALSDVAAAVVTHGKVGKVALSFDLKQIGNSHQVMIKHGIIYTKPTSKGEVTEKNLTETPMHVNVGGELTLFPKNQEQMFGKKGEPNI